MRRRARIVAEYSDVRTGMMLTSNSSIFGIFTEESEIMVSVTINFVVCLFHNRNGPFE